MPRTVPFPNCWWVGEHLLAGPAFLGTLGSGTSEDLDALYQAGIRAIIGLIPTEHVVANPELRMQLEEEIQERFSHQVFPLGKWCGPNPGEDANNP